MTLALPKVELPRPELVALMHRLADAVETAEITIEDIGVHNFGSSGGQLVIRWKVKP